MDFRPTGVYVLFPKPMYRGILELIGTSSLHKNGSLSTNTCYGLTALFLKTKIYFHCCKFINKQININSKDRFFILTLVNM